MTVTFSEHALQKLRKRKIPLQLAELVAGSPEQTVEAAEGRLCLQSRVEVLGRPMLLRLIVESANEELQVITVYLTSKLRKYWSEYED